MIKLRGNRNVHHRRHIAAAILLFIAGVVFWGGFNTAMEATNKLEFCISCHEMENTVYQEYKHSTHYTNASGVQAVCADCHVPKEWARKLIRKIKASKELYYWITGSIDTKEKFEAKRGKLAESVWQSMRSTNSRECRNCHLFSMMNTDKQGRFAAKYHRDTIDHEINEDAMTCIDCHQGITHKLPQKKGGTKHLTLSRDNQDYAEEIHDTCAGCHGEFAEGSLDGEYPRLAGMGREYLIRQINHFKTRQRLNIPMLPYATDRELPNEDIEIIATYLASIELATELPEIDEQSFNAFERLQQSKRVINIPRYPGNVSAGGRLYAQECASCHGVDGKGKKQKAVPRLSGQYSEYLKRQIALFSSGDRLHDSQQDAEIFQMFTDQEIGNILSWLSISDDAKVEIH